MKMELKRISDEKITNLLYTEDGELIDSNVTHIARTVAQAQLEDNQEKVQELFTEIEKLCQ